MMHHITHQNIWYHPLTLCPNGQTSQSRKLCLLDFPALPGEICEGHIIPSLSHSSLVSIYKLFDAILKAVLKSQEVIIKRKVGIFIQQEKYRRNRLQKTPLTAQLKISPTQPQIKQINNSHQTSSLTELIQYLNAAYFILVTSTCIKSIDVRVFNHSNG